MNFLIFGSSIKVVQEWIISLNHKFALKDLIVVDYFFDI